MSQSRSYTPPYGKRITLLLIGCATLGTILGMVGESKPLLSPFGAAFFVGAMSAAFIMDWFGVTTLCELLDWQRIHGRKRAWLIMAWVCLFPLCFCIYCVRVAIRQFSTYNLPTSPAPAQKRIKVGLVIGLVVVCLGLISAFGSATGATATPSPAIGSTPTAAMPSSIAQDASTQEPAILPTDTPVPTDTPTPVPTSKPKPTTPPKPTGVNGNPWGYNFTSGNLIYSPPADFCDYFACIENFWNGRGFVNECQDETYSKSGSIRGDCSHHGGEMRPLYSH